MLRISLLVTFISVLLLISAGGCSGELEQPIFRGEADFFKVRNITDGGDFGNNINASFNDILEFKLYVHNTAVGSLAHDVLVSSELQETRTAGVTCKGYISCKEALITTVEDNAFLTIPDGAEVNYIEGSSWMRKRYGGGAYEDTDLPDGILDGYINIGNVRGGNGEDFGVDIYFRVSVNGT